MKICSKTVFLLKNFIFQSQCPNMLLLCIGHVVFQPTETYTIKQKPKRIVLHKKRKKEWRWGAVREFFRQRKEKRKIDYFACS